jgi:hypothetical protein
MQKYFVTFQTIMEATVIVKAETAEEAAKKVAADTSRYESLPVDTVIVEVKEVAPFKFKSDKEV